MQTRKSLAISLLVLPQAHVHQKQTLTELDSMCWFSHWCRSATEDGSRKKCSTLLFFVPGDLDCWPLTFTFELGQHFCTMQLTTKFHHPMFNHSEIIVLTNKLTNKQTLLKTSTSLRYATPVESVYSRPFDQMLYRANGEDWRTK